MPNPASLKSQFADIEQIVLRHNSEADLEELRNRIISLLSAVGVWKNGTEWENAFRTRKEKLAISHKALAGQFRKFAAAKDPLDPAICRGIPFSELNALVRTAWSKRERRLRTNLPASLRGVSADMLSEDDLNQIRSLAEQLAEKHQKQVLKNRPPKTNLDTLLNELGVLFAWATDFPGHQHELQHHEVSQFVQFCYLVLEPFFHGSEVSTRAIARRWERLKKHESAADNQQDSNSLPGIVQ